MFKPNEAHQRTQHEQIFIAPNAAQRPCRMHSPARWISSSRRYE
ncbi:MAG: hypothetical protein R2867_16860 [Caldilineaceae bacterium]